MRLEESPVLTAEVFEPKTFSAFGELIDPEWISSALEARGDITMRRTRRRRLPAEEIIWLVIGMALFRDKRIVDVARLLEIGDGPSVSDSAATQARGRLGKEPLAWLFGETARAWAHDSAARDRWRGQALVSMARLCACRTRQKTPSALAMPRACAARAPIRSHGCAR